MSKPLVWNKRSPCEHPQHGCVHDIRVPKLSAGWFSKELRLGQRVGLISHWKTNRCRSCHHLAPPSPSCCSLAPGHLVCCERQRHVTSLDISVPCNYVDDVMAQEDISTACTQMSWLAKINRLFSPPFSPLCSSRARFWTLKWFNSEIITHGFVGL